MTERTATLDSSAAVRATLQAALFYNREQRLKRQGATTAVPVILLATPTGGDVAVSGTSVSGALIIVYVDGIESARARAAADGTWSTEVTGLTTGIYDFIAIAESFGTESSASAATEVTIT